jgi:hypothetical protein
MRDVSGKSDSDASGKNLPLFEIARVLVRVDHIAHSARI